MIDPALILAQVSQGERLAHDIQIAPILAQAAAAEAAAKQLTAEQHQVQEIEKGAAAKSPEQKVEDRRSRQPRQREQHQRRPAQLLQENVATPLEAAASDSQADEVSGIIVNTSV